MLSGGLSNIHPRVAGPVQAPRPRGRHLSGMGEGSRTCGGVS